MDSEINCSYWQKLKEKRIKISLGTITNLFYTCYILDVTPIGIIIEDRDGKEIFLNFTNIKFCEPFREKEERGMKKNV